MINFLQVPSNFKVPGTFVEIEMLVEKINDLISFCFDYMPSSVEIIKPESLKVNSRDIQNMLNDLQARLHSTDMLAKKQKFEINLLKKSLNAGLKNLISLALVMKKKLTKDELSKFSGIEENQLDPFLETMINEGHLKKEEDLYSLNK